MIRFCLVEKINTNPKDGSKKDCSGEETKFEQPNKHEAQEVVQNSKKEYEQEIFIVKKQLRDTTTQF